MFTKTLTNADITRFLSKTLNNVEKFEIIQNELPTCSGVLYVKVNKANKINKFACFYNMEDFKIGTTTSLANQWKKFLANTFGKEYTDIINATAIQHIQNLKEEKVKLLCQLHKVLDDQIETLKLTRNTYLKEKTEKELDKIYELKIQTTKKVLTNYNKQIEGIKKTLITADPVQEK